ncbi:MULTISPECIES: ABC transporter ATP-binding protein [unclassified Cryobacterium]|uniref:ABC transporter ATP-binding protein n=1 Tax=unclassified Cryobacterium TaxID=2649013 RepID=UPI0018E0AF72|nr:MULTISPECIES: ABC transporter ATP-binding protein [unclassified Cryobacterium]
MIAVSVVNVNGLRKQYGGLTVVDDLSFSIEQGEIFALLGPNGAGKTTAVEILEGHRTRDGGTVDVLGFDPETGGRAFRERIGIVLQEAGFDEDFTVGELVRLYRGLYPRRRDADAVIGQVGLAEKRNARVKTLSGGQRRRLDLALGLVGDPEVLFLDEPTTGFDPSARLRAWDLVEGLREMGKTVLLTTHYLDEAEHLADRVAVIVRGWLVALGTPAALAAEQHAAVVSFRLPEGAEPRDLPALESRPLPHGADWEVATDHPAAVVHALTGWALGLGSELPALSVRRPSLEDAYLSLIGGADAADAAEAASGEPRP